MVDVEDATVPGTVYTDVLALFGVCNFRGSGEVTWLNTYDTTTLEASGTYEVEITCVANCFECGGDGDRRSFEGAFDVHWRDVD